MFEDNRETQSRDIRLFVILGFVVGALAVFFFGELVGLVALYVVGPIAVCGPFVTGAYVLTRKRALQVANNLVLIFLIAGTAASVMSGMFFFGYQCGNCGWPLNVPKILLVSVPLVVAGTFWAWLRAD